MKVTLLNNGPKEKQHCLEDHATATMSKKVNFGGSQATRN